MRVCTVVNDTRHVEGGPYDPIEEPCTSSMRLATLMLPTTAYVHLDDLDAPGEVDD